MKKKIYVLPDSPAENEVKEILRSLSPPFNPRTSEQLLISYRQIQSRLRDAAINKIAVNTHHTQSVSDGKHTVTLVGQMDTPTRFQKFLDILR